MKQFKIYKGISTKALNPLNESASAEKKPKYVFSGVFTQCSTPDHKIINRNGRIYQEKEVLRHLGYLREQIEEQGGILGELDHPEGRFDISMQSASHMITDLWYDNKTKCVMGKLKVLDTPNGMILRELIDAGYPLYVSSRAAGDVNERTKEVEIAQIFTYDVVCTPGFKEAKLERVNESLSTKAATYLNESISIGQSKQEKPVLINENEIPTEAISQFNDTTAEDVANPLSESEPQDFLPVMQGNTDVTLDDQITEEEEDKENSDSDETKETPDSETKDQEGEKDEEQEGLTDDEKAENKKLILNIVGIQSDENPDDDMIETNRDDIIDITAVEDNDDNEGEADEDIKECDETSECGSKKTPSEITKNALTDCESFEQLLASVKKAEAVKESIVKMYPFSISLSESNFAKFAALRPKLKQRCADFINEYQIYDVMAINELWQVPLREDKKVQENWLRLASKIDIDLYCQAPLAVQNAIEEQAKLVILETQEDVDKFWGRMGLRQQAAKRRLNEESMRAFNQMQPTNSKRPNNGLGYSLDLINLVESNF